MSYLTEEALDLIPRHMRPVVVAYVERGAWCDDDHRCCSGRKSCGACVRGLLCQLCNTAIALLGDDDRRLLRAAEYIGMRSGEVRVA